MKVLCGIGGQADAIRALDQTIVRATSAGDELTVAVLDNPESDLSPAEVESLVRERLADSDLDASVRRVDGDAGARLLEIAEAEGFDEIVLGGGERSPMGKIRLGQIAEFVVMNATVTVTLVR